MVAGINKYKMSLLGSSSGNYYHNTISFVPYALMQNIDYAGAPPGSYTGNLKVTFGVE